MDVLDAVNMIDARIARSTFVIQGVSGRRAQVLDAEMMPNPNYTALSLIDAEDGKLSTLVVDSCELRMIANAARRGDSTYVRSNS